MENRDKTDNLKLEQILKDDDVLAWVSKIIKALVEYNRINKNKNEQPIAIMTVDYKTPEQELQKIDIGIQLLDQTEKSIIIRIGTKVLGIANEQEEVYAEILNSELKLLSSSTNNSTLNLIPLAQEVYDRFADAAEHGNIFKAINAKKKYR